MATSSGPLCEEQMQDVCFIVEDVMLKSGPAGGIDL